jgi:hypothetical protein
MMHAFVLICREEGGLTQILERFIQSTNERLETTNERASLCRGARSLPNDERMSRAASATNDIL